MRIIDWSSVLCSSDLAKEAGPVFLRSMTIHEVSVGGGRHIGDVGGVHPHLSPHRAVGSGHALFGTTTQHTEQRLPLAIEIAALRLELGDELVGMQEGPVAEHDHMFAIRSEEHTSELKSLMRISY